MYPPVLQSGHIWMLPYLGLGYESWGVVYVFLGCIYTLEAWVCPYAALSDVSKEFVKGPYKLNPVSRGGSILHTLANTLCLPSMDFSDLGRCGDITQSSLGKVKHLLWSPDHLASLMRRLFKP